MIGIRFSLREQSRIAPPSAPTIVLDPTRLPPDLFNRIGPLADICSEVAC
jgi:hypothetical protein